MVRISKEQLEEFKRLYKNRFGKEISDQMELIYKPMTQEEFDALEKRRKGA